MWLNELMKGRMVEWLNGCGRCILVLRLSITDYLWQSPMHSKPPQIAIPIPSTILVRAAWLPHTISNSVRSWEYKDSLAGVSAIAVYCDVDTSHSLRQIDAIDPRHWFAHIIMTFFFFFLDLRRSSKEAQSLLERPRLKKGHGMLHASRVLF